MSRGEEQAGSRRKSEDWRWLIAVTVLGYAILVLGAAFLFGTAQPLLQGLGVPALEYPLMDLRGVAAWCDAWSQGQDPAVVATTISLPGNTGSWKLESGGWVHRQPMCSNGHASNSRLPAPNFLMNYSPFVLALGHLGLSATSVAPWGIILALLYLIALVALCGPCSFRQALFWALLACSPASVLVIERGNLDELVFALIVLALMLRKHPLAESGVILGASVIKFFPIVSLLAPWKESVGKMKKLEKQKVAVTDAKQRPGQPIEKVRLGLVRYFYFPNFSFQLFPSFLLPAVLLFALFLLLLHSRLTTISGSLGGQYQSAFGYSVLADLLRHDGFLKLGEAETARRILKLCALLGMIGSFAAGILLRPPFARQPVSERARHAFFLTAPIMLGLFVQGPQMDYKWIFFLPMIPAVLEIAGSPFHPEALGAKTWLCAMTTYSYWTFFSDEGSLRNALLKQLLMWGVIFLSAFLAGGIWNRRNSP